MSYTARLRKVGGSIMLAIPPALLAALDMRTDSQVAISMRNGKLMVEPQARPRYGLDDLLAQCSADAGPEVSDRLWLQAPPEGREII